jgi:hypothetical protein
VGLFSLVAYGPLAVRRSAWSDDFPLVVNDSMNKAVSDGRPVLAFLNSLVLGSIESIGGLVVARLIGVVGLAVLLGYLTRLLLGLGWPPLLASLTGCSMGLLPPFHVYAGWASVFTFPWVMLLGAASGQLWLRSLVNRQRHWAALALLGMTAALLAYPPAAMFCWVPLGLRLISTPNGPRASVVESCRMGLLVIAAGPISLVLARVSMAILGVEPDGRFHFIGSVPELVDKIRWFVSRPPAIAARPFVISSPSDVAGLLTAAPVLLVVVAGLLLRYRGPVQDRVASLAVFAGVAMMTMFSHLITPENQTEYRYMAGLIVLTWAALVLACREVFGLALAGRRALGHRETVVALALLGVIGAGTLLARQNIEQVFVRPAQVKEEYLLEHLQGFDPSRHRRIVVIDAAGHWPSRQNLGIYSVRTDLAHPWVIDPNIRLLLAERHGYAVAPQIVVVFEPTDLGPHDFLLDLRPLVKHF